MKKTNGAHFLITPFSIVPFENVTAFGFLFTTSSTPYVEINPNTIHPIISNYSIHVE
jgi:hypothetical protein